MARPFYLYNTATRSKETFSPSGETVGMYCCGPTVYHYAHIGNLRTYVNEDILRRALEGAGYPVKHVMNVTDVGHLVSDADEGEDKMAKGARREGKSVWEVAKFYEDAFYRDTDDLNVLRPHVSCRATEHIQEMIDQVRQIEGNGYTYTADGNVYFDVAKFPRYTDLARQDLEQLVAGARVEVDEAKKGPADFVLWFTRSKHGNQDMQWDSPWGRGFPGWHIECSAMSMKYLGEQFDIHCGGVDHVPTHHTNELAQAEAATGKVPWVKYWVHCEFIVFTKGKMSKSSGDFLTLESVRERKMDPLAYRMFCLSGHYRSQLTFSWEAVESAAQSLKRLRSLVPSGEEEPAGVEELIEPFWDAMCDDLNAPKALGLVWDTMQNQEVPAPVRRAYAKAVDSVLGLDLLREEAALPVHEFQMGGSTVKVTGDGVTEDQAREVATKVVERASARKQRDFATADRLRDELNAQGVTVKDLPDGTTECEIR